jgi:hypothetical protein
METKYNEKHKDLLDASKKTGPEIKAEESVSRQQSAR